MKKINIIKENKDYSRIISNIKPLKYKDYMIFLEKNNSDTYHFGFSVSKKLCNAVNRNKTKRQLKSIIDKKDYKKGFNCIIMIRKSFLEKNFQTKENNLYEAFNKLEIIKEKTNE